MANITNYEFRNEAIYIGGVSYPVIVAYITLDTVVNVGQNVSITRPTSFVNDLTDFAKTHPSILGLKWGSSFNNFFSSVVSADFGSAEEFKLQQRAGSGYVNEYLYYKERWLFTTSSSWGSHSSNECSCGVECVYVDAATGNIYSISESYSPIPDSNLVRGASGIPPFGVNFTDTNVPYGLMVDPEIRSRGGTATCRKEADTWEETPKPPIPPTDPYEQGGTSTTGGGNGTFSETGDTVGIPSLPTLSAVDTGFITLFNPTAAQVKQLAAYMWSSGFDLDTFKNVVANPIDCILGLTIVPVDPTNAGTKAVTVGNIPTSVNMPYLSSQYVEVDCGTLAVAEFWGSYLDYSPYTKMSLYLPYIGIVPLDIDDVMNASISIKYHVDVLSGACVAYVLCNGTQLYTYIGQCSSNVPITSNDFTNTVNGILGIAGNIGSLVSSGGNAGGIISAAANIASNAINAVKPNVQKSGAMSGTGGLMGVQTPYLICQRPRQSVPASQNSFTGYPANITLKLGDLSGYTEVERIHLEGVPCTNEEMDEIMTLLESGVYI